MSGFCTSAARLGAPDTGLISYQEMVDQGRYIHEATRSIPVIGDGDTGYGNALNVKRTVRGYAAAGFAGILLEDQQWPKSCGHVRGKRVASRQEAVSRIRAAVDARDEEGLDILIVARTDARQAESLDEALWRIEAFANAGADILFVDALESEDEMRAFANLRGVAAIKPKMANMLEGGGKTPVLPPARLQSLGFKLVAYPLSLLGVSIRAMENALSGLQEGRVPDINAMGSFLDIQRAVGFPEYFEEEARYAVAAADPAAPAPPEPLPGTASPQHTEHQQQPASSSGSPDLAEPSSSDTQREAWRQEFGRPSAAEGGDGLRDAASSSAPETEHAGVDADAIIPPNDIGSQLARIRTDAGSSSDGSGDGSGDSGNWDSLRRSKFLRVRIIQDSTGLVKLETRIPAGFLSGITALVPQVDGINFEALINKALGERWDLNKPLSSFSSGADTVEIYLE